MNKSKEELKKLLSEDEYKIIVEKATEMPFTGKYLHNEQNGIYHCLVCNSELFSSDTKFDSGSGWPSFYDVSNNKNIKIMEDTSHGMERLEVQCSNCGAHLGHLFEDGPEPTGKRYCINSASLEFLPK
ncbi:peptide-methionine (R)-S-oxide reductase MsrB [Candidatus Dojkabacteria bacterium]|uniref:Peptide methionine sulfoxide reductase MsrB n=1 Tax=Candidatus Dojkabacteria bacterium TaxID=2099670 RepID=A0A955I5V7_9BACT|nr:peptide-methionine (R)-S-oxide reductase MsrB [Candidatus Dojkabacteria bacterium]